MPQDPSSDSDVWMLPLTGSDRKPVALLQTRANETWGRVSPDGRWLAYASDQGGSNQVFIRPFMRDGEVRQVSLNRGTRPVWSHDGRRLYFVEPTHRILAADIDGNGNRVSRVYSSSIPKSSAVSPSCPQAIA
jgi:Tol biopolymer transport system component